MHPIGKDETTYFRIPPTAALRLRRMACRPTRATTSYPTLGRKADSSVEQADERLNAVALDSLRGHEASTTKEMFRMPLFLLYVLAKTLLLSKTDNFFRVD